jgi:hypothetical protein
MWLLLLHRIGLAPTTSCRSPGTLRKNLDTTDCRHYQGVASKYLLSYLGWRRMIERGGARLTPRNLIGQALAT